MPKDKYPAYFFIACFLLLIYLFFSMLKPLFSALLLSTVIVFVFYPIYKWLNKKTKRENLSSIIMCILVLLVVIVPSILLVGVLVNQSYAIYSIVKEKVVNGEMIGGCESGFICNFINQVFNRQQLSNYISIAIQKITSFIVNHGTNFVKGISSMIVAIAIMVLSMFYFFKDGPSFIKFLEEMIPIKKRYSNKIIKQFEQIVYAAIHGNLITALAQGFIGAIGFLIVNYWFNANIQTPLLWSAMMALFALIPIIGTAIIWLPIVLIQVAIGNYLAGIILMIYCILFVSTIDNFIKPKIISRSVRLHPLLVFLSVFGGLITFGFIGLLLGPLVIALLTVFIKIYEVEYRKEVI